MLAAGAAVRIAGVPKAIQKKARTQAKLFKELVPAASRYRRTLCNAVVGFLALLQIDAGAACAPLSEAYEFHSCTDPLCSTVLRDGGRKGEREKKRTRRARAMEQRWIPAHRVKGPCSNREHSNPRKRDMTRWR